MLYRYFEFDLCAGVRPQRHLRLVRFHGELDLPCSGGMILDQLLVPFLIRLRPMRHHTFVVRGIAERIQPTGVLVLSRIVLRHALPVDVAIPPVPERAGRVASLLPNDRLLANHWSIIPSIVLLRIEHRRLLY